MFETHKIEIKVTQDPYLGSTALLKEKAQCYTSGFCLETSLLW